MSSIRRSRSTLDTDPIKQRQSKRDETIRKKLEHDLQKRGPMARVKQTKKVATVSALQPMRGLVVKETLSMVEAAQLMAARSSHCLLVMNQQEQLCGILTAKDIAYRGVATSRPGLVVSDIMTPDPMCVTMDTNAQDVLTLMVTRGFRHVPVCTDDGELVGVLDITKCLYDALETMDRVYGSSQRLFDAWEGVEKEWPMSISSSATTTTSSLSTDGTSSSPLASWMLSLRNRMACPDISTLLTPELSKLVQVSVKTSVRDVVRRMRDHGTTAALVMDHDNLAGIFCTKDLVLRVLAAGLKPENCSVVRVMTPEPDTALPETTILQALKKMHDGHYLNLPVVDKSKTILGLIDVLSLTYATMELINTVKRTADTPYWPTTKGDDTDSVVSVATSIASYTKDTSSGVSTTACSMTTATTTATTTKSPQQQQQQKLDKEKEDNTTFTFKFTYRKKTYRFRSASDNFDTLYTMIALRIHRSGFSVFYTDEDHDRVVMTTHADVMDVVHLARCLGQDRALLLVAFDDEDDDEPEKRNPPKNAAPLLIPTAFTLLGILFLGMLTKRHRR